MSDTKGAEKTLEGHVAELDSEEKVLEAMEKAFDYRGDVTLTLVNGEEVEGYLFDRRTGKTVAESSVRLMPREGDEKRTIGYGQIVRVAFTGRDTASGKSWETWVKKYVEKKKKGEAANIEAEKLD